MVRCLCVMDSIGKTIGSGASRQYWKEVAEVLRQHHNMELHVSFHQGAGLQALCQEAVGIGDMYDFQLLLSFGNDLISQAGQNVPIMMWQAIKPQMISALRQLSNHWSGRVHEVVFGGIGDMWQIPILKYSMDELVKYSMVAEI